VSFDSGRGYVNQTGHDVAQVCRAGHLITKFAVSHPEDRSNFCPECSAATMMACESCSFRLEGADLDIVMLGFTYVPPKFCPNCGQPFPWTKAREDAANELIDLLDHLSAQERQDMKRDLGDLITEGPRTKVATLRMKLLLAKGGGEARSLLVDVISQSVSETIRKALGLP